MLRDLGMKSCLAHNLDGWARLATAEGDPERAARLLGALTAHLSRLGMSLIPLQQALHEQTLAAVRQQLGSALFEAHRQTGEQLDLEEAIALATNRFRDAEQTACIT